MTARSTVAVVAVLLVAAVACGQDADDPGAAPPSEVTTDRIDDGDDGDDGDAGDAATATEEETVEEEAMDPQAPALVPTVWPEVIVAGVPSEVLVSVAPRGEVSGPVTYVAGPVEGELRDEGGVHAGEVELTVADDVEVVVSATVDGRPASGRATVSVTAGDLPTDPAPAPSDPRTVTAGDGAEVLSDRVVVRFADGVTDAEVRAAAAAVDGTPIGRLSATTWQVGVEPAATWDELAAVLDRVASQPRVVDATPVGVGGLDGDG